MNISPFTSGQVVRRVVEETSRLDADLVLLPGYLINNALADLSDALDTVGNMQSRYGSYLSVGNHDLIEDGADPLFVQQQAGHSWASTTAAYTTVGQDARNRMLRSALARAFEGEDGR